MSLSNMSPRPTSLCHAITQMIESVAQEQAALGRILNAEADKLDKIVSLACTRPHELLMANQSVDRLINSVARLEMILQSKLQMFDDCLCTCSPCPMGDETE